MNFNEIYVCYYKFSNFCLQPILNFYKFSKKTCLPKRLIDLAYIQYDLLAIIYILQISEVLFQSQIINNYEFLPIHRQGSIYTLSSNFSLKQSRIFSSPIFFFANFHSLQKIGNG